jgi:SAM-dependent methyltransferase
MLDPLEMYATGIDASDYTARVVPHLAAVAGGTGALLDVGAGGGQLGAQLRRRFGAWLAVEPGARMRARLRGLDPAPEQIIDCGWEDLDLARAGVDCVLAANIAAPLTDARAFLAQCRRWSRNTIVWVVPAQHGPRGLGLAGCLPREWHGEDETPGVEIVRQQLGHDELPPYDTVSWTFTLPVADVQALARYLADRLGWSGDDPRRAAMYDLLAARLRSDGQRDYLDVPRASAILVWRLR